jgi:hypothetical protein
VEVRIVAGEGYSTRVPVLEVCVDTDDGPRYVLAALPEARR